MIICMVMRWRTSITTQVHARFTSNLDITIPSHKLSTTLTLQHDVANSVWARSSIFKKIIIGNAFCCFIPGSSFVYPLKVCSNKNNNDPYGSILQSYLKFALKAWDRHPAVSMTVSATSIFFGPLTNSACLTACAKVTRTIFLSQMLNLSRKTSLLKPINHRNLHHLSQSRIRLDLVLSTFELA